MFASAYDLLFLGAIVMPIAALHFASWRLCRGFGQLTQDQRARRAYFISWGVSFGLIIQMAGVIGSLEAWGERMPLTLWLGDVQLGGMHFLHNLPGQWAITILVTCLGMLIMALDITAFGMAWFRIDRLAKSTDGNRGVMAKQVRLSLRSLFASGLPVALGLAGMTSMPDTVWNDPGLFALMLTGFLFVIYSLSPTLVQWSHPTECLPPDHPVAVMACELCRAANIRVGGIRLLKFGEARIANALVSGLLPWYRRIYVSDRLLDTFTAAEVRSILAHEIGHVKKMHLWYYLAFSVLAGLVPPWLATRLAELLGLTDPILPTIVLMVAWWGVLLSYCSRRFEHEADRYALELTGDAPTFVRALEKLAEVNCVVKMWGKWDVFQRHPDIAGRVAAASRLL